MNKKRWIPNASTKNTNNSHQKKTDARVTLVLFSVILIYMWIMLLTYYIENNQKNSTLQDHRGLIFDLDKDSYNFQIKGFEYFENSPIKKRPGLKAKRVWFLRPLNHGNIVIKDIPKHMNRRPTHVSVLIKYHLGRPARSELSVSGVNTKTKEKVTNDMSQSGNGYCTRILFFGFVHEIAVDASVQKNGGFVIIDQLIIGLGYYVFDGLEEETCS